MLLVDTSVIVPCLRRTTKRAYLGLLSELTEDEAPAISVISRFEVLAGTLPEHADANRHFLGGFLQAEAGVEAADLAGNLYFEWSRKGHRLTANDLFIGATARIGRMILLTANSKHFPYLRERERRTIHYQSNRGQKASDTVVFME